MDKQQRNSFLIALGVGIVLGGVSIFIVHKTRKKKRYTFKQLSKFIENPSKLNSPDEPNSWKKMSPELLYNLEKISKKIGRKLRINSGYRSKQHNANVGGASRSAHMTGDAVDISIPSYNEAIKIGRIAKGNGIKRIGIARSFIHIDTSSKLSPARWTYSGSGVTKSKIEKDLGFA